VRGTLDAADRRYLRLAIELSGGYGKGDRRWPFGAVVVARGSLIGRGVNQVVELNDPTAHAEVIALRAAAAELRSHAIDDGVLYSSAEPCPMCLAASYWARITRIVFAATTRDVAQSGFDDLTVYDQLRLPTEERSIREDPGSDDVRAEAVTVLAGWRKQAQARPDDFLRLLLLRAAARPAVTAAAVAATVTLTRRA
jgi:tRNA(Arg) A34 adenosine deaminase TadA